MSYLALKDYTVRYPPGLKLGMGLDCACPACTILHDLADCPQLGTVD